MEIGHTAPLTCGTRRRRVFGQSAWPFASQKPLLWPTSGLPTILQLTRRVENSAMVGEAGTPC